MISYIYVMSEGEGYKIRDQTKPHFLTFTVVDWVDVFTRQRYKDILIESLNYCISNKGLVVYGYVIMSNHVHSIMHSDEGLLSDIIRDFKKHTSKRIIQSIQEEPESRREWMLERFSRATTTHSRNKSYQFWKYGNHPVALYSEKFMWTKLDYIHLNPVRAGLVKKASDYGYSSAVNYVKNDGIVTVTLLDNPVVDTLKPDSFWKSITW